MALYFGGQMVARNQTHGVVTGDLITKEMVITYPFLKTKFYTILIYGDQDVYTLCINVKEDKIKNGEMLIDPITIKSKTYPYDISVSIYEQPKRLPLPPDDFDMEEYIEKQKLECLYTMDFTVLPLMKEKINYQKVYKKKMKMFST